MVAPHGVCCFARLNRLTCSFYLCFASGSPRVGVPPVIALRRVSSRFCVWQGPFATRAASAACPHNRHRHISACADALSVSASRRLGGERLSHACPLRLACVQMQHWLYNKVPGGNTKESQVGLQSAPVVLCDGTVLMAVCVRLCRLWPVFCWLSRRQVALLLSCVRCCLECFSDWHGLRGSFA
jgi:hypothetical protein